MTGKERPTDLEKVLAPMLHLGTWLASAVIALGLALAVVSGAKGAMVADGGIIFFIALPVARVITMMLFFARARDYLFSGIAATVLAIIVSSYLLGAR